MSDLIETWKNDFRAFVNSLNLSRDDYKTMMEYIDEIPSVQPELTDEQSIAHLQSSGWMQRHDKEIYKSGLKEQLADDSDSYDSLLPSVHPDHVADISKKVEGDCISRQAAIDAVGDWIYNPEDLRYHKDVINSIPAVQPEIVRCKDCKHWDAEWSVSESGAHYCPMVDGNRNSDFYCADAERRTDG